MITTAKTGAGVVVVVVVVVVVIVVIVVGVIVGAIMTIISHSLQLTTRPIQLIIDRAEEVNQKRCSLLKRKQIIIFAHQQRQAWLVSCQGHVICTTVATATDGNLSRSYQKYTNSRSHR